MTAKNTPIGWNDSAPISGKIVFDQKRELIYTDDTCESGRNPLNPYIWEFHLCGYVYLDTNSNGHSEYIYIIDDTDYEQAVPIVG